MKNREKYLSGRVRTAIAALLAFSGLLLVLLGVACVSARWLLWVLAPAALLYALLVAGVRRWLAAPFRESEKMMELFSGGYTLQGVSQQRYPVSPATEAAFSKLQEFLTTNDLIGATSGGPNTWLCKTRSTRIFCTTRWRASAARPSPPGWTPWPR